MTAAQVEEGELFAATPDMFVGFGDEAYPDAVDCRVGGSECKL